MSQLHVNALGQFEIILDGEAVSWFPTDRVRALLLVLAVEPTLSMSRLTLANLLWSDVPDSAARRNLRSCLLRLKKVLGDNADAVLVATRQAIGLTATHSDYNQFQALVTSDNPADWQTAADYKVGELAAGFALKNSPLFDEWLAEKRLALVQRQRDLLQKLLDSVAVDPNVHLRYAEQLIASDPYNDVAQRAVMTAHVALGNTSAALTHYEQYASFLQAELSTKPEPATCDLYARLIASIASRPAKLHNFPRQIAPFIGRVADRDAVLARLRQESCQMVTILGAGGMGKTWLASEVARHLTSADFADGAYFVPLVNATSEYDAIALLHRTLALPMQGNDMLGQVLEHLRNKRLLLVLDNLEQLSGQLRFLARLLQTAKGVKILTTSRDVVGISAEYRYPLDGIKDLHEATAILWSAIKRVAPNFEVTPTNIAIGAVICQRLHGVPLALELAATWINTLDLDSIREEIEHAYTFLESPMLDTPDRHRSLGAIFDHSWELLQPKQQQILAAASIFRGGFDIKAARAILGAGIHDLRRLVEQSLLIKVDDRAHYTLHELVRQFAAEKLSSADKATAQQAHANYYLSLVSKFEQQLVSEDALAASEVISTDLANVRAAWRWAVQMRQTELLLQMVTALSRFYALTARYSQGNQLFVETIGQLNNDDDAALLARLHIGCALFRIRQVQNDQAIDSAEKALASARSADDNVMIAQSHNYWGQALRAKGDYQAAVAQSQQALAACAYTTAHDVRADSLCNLAIMSAFGSGMGASQTAEKALAALRLTENKVVEVQALNVAAFASINAFELSKAYALTEAGLALSRQMGDRAGEALALNMRGRTFQFLGQYDRLYETLSASQKLYQSIDDPLGEIYILSQFAQTSLMRSKFEAALHYANQVLKLTQGRGATFHHANSLGIATLALNELGDSTTARRMVTELTQLSQAHTLPATFQTDIQFCWAILDHKAGATAEALARISTIIDQILDNQPVCRPVTALFLHFWAYQILHTNSDPRAAQLLRHAVNDIQTKAARITNPDHRQTFLEQIPHHRTLIALCKNSQP